MRRSHLADGGGLAERQGRGSAVLEPPKPETKPGPGTEAQESYGSESGERAGRGVEGDVAFDGRSE